MAFFCNSIGRLWRNRIISVQHPHHDVTSSTSLERCLLRSVWSEAPSTETLPGERFYDSTVEKVTHKSSNRQRYNTTVTYGSLKDWGLLQYALQEIEALSLQQMLEFGRAALFNESKILTSARHAQREVCCLAGLVLFMLTCHHLPRTLQWSKGPVKTILLSVINVPLECSCQSDWHVG